MLSTRLTVLLAAVAVVIATPLCENGFTLFDNLDGRENRETCVKLMDPIGNWKATVSLCRKAGGATGYPLSFIQNGTTPATNSMLQFLKDLITAAEASGKTVSPLLFLGAQQTGTTITKSKNWQWIDAASGGAKSNNIALLFDTAANQPDDGDAAKLDDTKVEQALAISKTSMLLHDVPFITSTNFNYFCEYNPRKPCPDGWSPFDDASTEEGHDSCFRLSSAQVDYNTARTGCNGGKLASFKFDGSGTAVSFLQQMATDQGLDAATTNIWTGALFSKTSPSDPGSWRWSDSTSANNLRSGSGLWASGQGAGAPTDNTTSRGYINAAAGKLFSGLDSLPKYFLCEKDIDLRIDPGVNGQLSSGLLLGLDSNGWNTFCTTTSSIYNQACVQTGYDYGIGGNAWDDPTLIPQKLAALSCSQLASLDGPTGGAACLAGLDGSTSPVTTSACPASSTGVVTVQCVLNPYAQTVGFDLDFDLESGDASTSKTNIAIGVVVGVVGAFVVAAAILFVVKSRANKRSHHGKLATAVSPASGGASAPIEVASVHAAHASPEKDMVVA